MRAITCIERRRYINQIRYRWATLGVGIIGHQLAETYRSRVSMASCLLDHPFSGVGVTFGNKLKANVEAGRIGVDEIKSDYKAFGKAASYQGLDLSTQVGSSVCVLVTTMQTGM